MTVAVITPPAPIVSRTLAKQHCKVELADFAEDELIDDYIAAASAAIDGPAGWVGRAFMPQLLELRLDGFDPFHWRCGSGWAWDGGWSDWSRWPFQRFVELPCPPLIDVVSVTYEDSSGVDQVLTPTGWRATEEGLEPAWGTSFPTGGRIDANAVRIRYRAGYYSGDLPAAPVLPTGAPPAPIKSAVLLEVGALYANRESTIIDPSRVGMVENPAAQNLLAPYRIWRV